MAFLEEHSTLEVLTASILSECQPFECGDRDMDVFFAKDALRYAYYRIGKTYCFRMNDDLKSIIACFTISNDSIRIYDLPSARRQAMWKITKREKILTRYPGVLIGRLAVASKYSRLGVGSEILEFIRMWFLNDANKTGCRFAIVDAKNRKDVLNFYEKNGFKYLFPNERDEDLYSKPPKNEREKAERLSHPRKLRTRLMFRDLLTE